MAKKTRNRRKKLPSLEELKKKIKGKVYIANETDKQMTELKDSLSNYKDSLSNYKDSLSNYKDSLRRSQAEVDSLKQVIKVRVK